MAETAGAGRFGRDFATTVMALVDAGRVGQAEEALVGLGAHLANLLDLFPVGTKGLDLDKLAHQYRMVLVALRGEDDDGPGDEGETAGLFGRLEAAIAEGRRTT